MGNDISKKIKDLRAERNMTLEEVAKIVGVGKSTVRKWETGMIQNVGIDKIPLLAKALGTTPKYLMGWEENKENDELARYLDELRTRSEMRMLFSVAEGATKEDVEKVVEMFKIMKGGFDD